jgi:SAM-dependent methyltransferase
MLRLAGEANAGVGFARYVRANAEQLPYRDHSFDASRAERIFQYVERPGKAIDEIIRVTRTGGRVLACDPDHESLVIDHPSLEVWRKVKNFRTDLTRPNGLGAHQLRRLFIENGLVDVGVEVRTLHVTRMDEAFGCETWGRRALQYGVLSKQECETWEIGLAELDRAGLFTYAIAYYSAIGTKPVK